MLEKCQPKSVFRIFEEFCALPHPSRNTAAATEYCCHFAQKHKLPYTVDAAGNVIIRKKATQDKKDAPTVILQGHLDMVAEKDQGYSFDFDREGLGLFLEGDLIGARGTSLGGDDGIAVAMILAILADKKISHPAIEAVFTTDEEIGMLGAEAMDMSSLTGRYMLNLDSEEEGVLTVSCAGGACATVTLPVEREEVSGTCLHIILDGMCGGHSGVEIDKGHLNATIFAAKTLQALSAICEVRLVDLHCGTKDNVIPSVADMRIFVSDIEEAENCVGTVVGAAQFAYAIIEPALGYSCEREKMTAAALSPACTTALYEMLLALPNGVQKMSADIEDLVQTSLNLGVLRTEEDRIRVMYGVRSSVGEELHDLLDSIQQKAATYGASFAVEGQYPAWEYKKESPLRETVLATYRNLYGKEMTVLAIHAGLECGLFADRLPGLECVSLGPNMRDIHTTRERLSVSSVARTYEFVCAILSAL